MEVLLQSLPREELTELLGKVEVVVIPVGSIEDHGPHLPPEQDTASVLYVAVEAARRLYPKVLVAPPVALGLSPHYMRWPGTVTLKGETLVRLIVDICESLAKHGFKRIAVLNGHGSNYNPAYLPGVDVAPIDLAVTKGRELGLKVTSATYWDLMPPGAFEEVLTYERSSGHGGEFETSIALYIHPEKVRRDKLGPAEGISKGAEAATREKGGRLIEAAVQGTVTFLKGFTEGRINEVHYRPRA
ncbi:MAG: creatininase family protein [Candidatus Bathyarchaeia archaeon]